MARIFISYKRADKEKVFKIKDQIETVIGEKCWIDLDGIESDAQFENVIIQAINDSEIVLFMYSKAHSKIEDFEKDWTIRELNFAEKKKKKIVFINVDGSELTDRFEFRYGTKQQVDGLSIRHIEKLIKDLCEWLGIFNSSRYQNYLTTDKNKKKDPRTEIYNVDGIEFKMIHVEGGIFKNDGMYGHMNEVKISDYMCGETLVTQNLWEIVMGNNPSRFKSQNRPVEQVNWNDCQEFLKKLNLKTGKQFRLLSEEEWEYAARGGKYSKGYQYSGSNNLAEVGWFKKNSNGETHNVKSKKANELGIYDMSGNVLEWCHDLYYTDDYKNYYNSQPKKFLSSPHCVTRGGGFYCSAENCSVSYPRIFRSPWYSLYDLGFRLAL